MVVGGAPVGFGGGLRVVGLDVFCLLCCFGVFVGILHVFSVWLGRLLGVLTSVVSAWFIGFLIVCLVVVCCLWCEFLLVVWSISGLGRLLMVLLYGDFCGFSVCFPDCDG